MPIQFRQLMLDLLFWLTAELLLNCVGLDEMADYSEYLKLQDKTGLLNPTLVVLA